jgi:hypothetical protein
MKNKNLFTIIIILNLTSLILPQGTIPVSEIRSVLKISPYFQYWNGINEKSIKQYSSKLFLNYFYDRNTRINLQSGYASSDVSETNISGISDAQLSVNYVVRKLNTAFDIGINLPTGKERIDEEKFPSSVLLSQDVFNMKIPLLGQGTNLFAGVTWANDVSDKIAIGIGASYLLKGKYNPLTNDTISYQPSNELLVTSGIDFKINSTTTLSGDVIGIFYGKDKINNYDAFSAGTKMIYSLLFRKYFGYNNLLILLRYRNSAVDKLNESPDVIVSEKINPNNFLAYINFRHYLSGSLSFYYSVEGRFYQKTAAPYSGYNVFGFGVISDIGLSSAFSLPVSVKYFIGNSKESSSIKGYEIGLGFTVNL